MMGLATGRYWSPQPSSNNRIQAAKSAYPNLCHNLIHTPDGKSPLRSECKRKNTLYRVRAPWHRRSPLLLNPSGGESLLLDPEGSVKDGQRAAKLKALPSRQGLLKSMAALD